MQKTLVEIIDIPLLLISASIYIAFQMYTTNYDYSVSDLIFTLFYFSLGWFIAGLILAYVNRHNLKLKNMFKEGFANTGECPNILLNKDGKFYLKNTDLAEIPGINPIVFDNLDEYVRYTNWQRSQGIDCDILYVKEEFDTQGNGVLVQRPSPLDEQRGMPVITGLNLVNTNNHSKLLDARNNTPFNHDQFSGYDPDDQYIGLITPLDKMDRDSIDNIKGQSSKDYTKNKQTQRLNSIDYKTEWPEGEDIKQYTVGNNSGQIILKKKGETPGANLD